MNFVAWAHHYFSVSKVTKRVFVETVKHLVTRGAWKWVNYKYMPGRYAWEWVQKVVLR
jgi:hypothetical protein